MRSYIFVLGLLAFTGAFQAEAADKPVALIWKGSKDKAEAEAQGDTWADLGKLLEKTGLSLPDGYPKLVESKTVPGLKPGFRVWLLGTCPSDEGGPVLEHLKLLAPGTYSRPVKLPAKKLACPKPPDSPLRARDEVLKLSSGETLRVFTQEETESPDEEGRGDSISRTRFHFVLFGKGGEVLATEDAEGDLDVSGNDPGSGPTSYRCNGTSIETQEDDGKMVLTRHCSANAFAECGSMLSADESVTVTVTDGAVSASPMERTDVEYAECD
ncbi:hypothetical protein D7X30_16260 [Corallococcus sp. AB011P]|uniref:hypothetical protein n=1 Tax=unclassified Corallococcus TaxID=2685029 RepID=UPI000EA2A52C|nr:MULTISPECIES: hypothetical protein [unclassified Corallococcus]RKG58038.1 hypothetical protein D7X30_16260 [Corallococcus sp. AB011P]RKH80942.1 hypothetical protein D7Y21_31270 [Corallococcus sp. AB045]